VSEPPPPLPAPPLVPPPPPPASVSASSRRPRGTSGRTSLVVLGVIVGVVFGANLANAALPLPPDPGLIDPGPGIPADPQPVDKPDPSPVAPGPVLPGVGVTVGAGFTIELPAGWTSVGAEEGVVLQKGGVLLVAAGFGWDGSATELAAAYRDAWFEDGEFSGDDPEAGSIGSGIAAAGLNYTGLWNGTQVDGAITAGVIDGSGLIVNVVAPTGGLNTVSSDLDDILGTVRHAGG
jgi:hypothetical protein